MANRIQTLRSSVPGARPAGRLPGELFVNWADAQLGVVNAANQPVDLLPIRFFSTLTSYNTGDHVVEGDNIYRALVDVAAGPFNPTQWQGNAAGDFVQRSGDVMTGGLRIEGVIPAGQPGEALQLAIEGSGVGGGAFMRLNALTGAGNAIAGFKAGNLRWTFDLGDQTAEIGANSGTNFGLSAYTDSGALLSTPLVINRADGRATFSGPVTLGRDPLLPLEAATREYVDAKPLNINRIDNGDMWVDQHRNGASIAVPNNAGVIGPDRWASVTNASGAGSKFTVGQNYPAAITTKPSGFQYFLGVQSSGAYTSAVAAQLYVAQNIEADAIGDLGFGAAGAQPITLSFWARSSLTGNFSVAFQSAGATPRTYVTTYSLPTANTWTRIVVTILGDIAGGATNWPNVGNGVGVQVIFDIGSGANFQTATLNAWQVIPYAAAGAVHVTATNAANWAVTGVKLEAGSVATPYPMEDLPRKLARCQRYYQIGTGTLMIFNSAAAAFGGALANKGLAVRMRAVPTVTQAVIASGAGWTGQVTLADADQAYVAIAGALTANATGVWTGFSFTASAEI